MQLLLQAQRHFQPEEVQVAMELMDIALTQPGQKDYMIRCAEGVEGEILGYVCYGKAPMTEAAYDLYWIVVHPSVQNQGVGTALLQRVEKELKEKRAHLVLIETSSLPAYESPRAFYRKHGYKEQARILHYYGYQNHKLIFSKTLHPLPER